jgi:hypothetical protein
MHILMATLLVVLGSLTPAKASNDGTWCYRDFGATRSTNCSFYSPRPCLIVAGTFARKGEAQAVLTQSDMRSSRLNLDSRTRLQTCTLYSE